MGHQRRISNVQGWSAYPPRLSVIADMLVRRPSARTGREQLQHRVQKKIGLLDQVIGANEQGEWHLKPKRLGCREVYDQFKLGGQFDREVGGFCAFKYPINVKRCPAIHMNVVWP